MGHHGVEPWNTRIWRPDVQTVKEGEQDLPVYELRTASSLKLPTEVYTYKVGGLVIVKQPSASGRLTLFCILSEISYY